MSHLTASLSVYLERSTEMLSLIVRERPGEASRVSILGDPRSELRGERLESREREPLTMKKQWICTHLIKKRQLDCLIGFIRNLLQFRQTDEQKDMTRKADDNELFSLPVDTSSNCLDLQTISSAIRSPVYGAISVHDAISIHVDCGAIPVHCSVLHFQSVFTSRIGLTFTKRSR